MFVRKSTYNAAIAERDHARGDYNAATMRRQVAERAAGNLRAERDAAKAETKRVTKVQGDVIRSHRREIERLRVEVAGLRDQLAKFNTRGSDGRFVKRADRVQAA